MGTQVLASLRFLAGGCSYQVDVDVLDIDQSTVVSRVVYSFCKSILLKKDRFVRFPFTVAEKNENKLKFYQMGSFPACILRIDGFHGNICTPFENENYFFNRKGFHSINVQAMTDANYKFANIVARWHGSTHDSFIFRTSDVHDYLRDNHTTLEHGVVLGDSGYSLATSHQRRRFNATQNYSFLC